MSPQNESKFDPSRAAKGMDPGQKETLRQADGEGQLNIRHEQQDIHSVDIQEVFSIHDNVDCAVDEDPSSSTNMLSPNKRSLLIAKTLKQQSHLPDAHSSTISVPKGITLHLLQRVLQKARFKQTRTEESVVSAFCTELSRSSWLDNLWQGEV
jgi:hypothetical protein